MKLLAAITTPFGADGQVDLDAFEAHLRWLGSQGLDGVFAGGTTGEGVLLEADELERLVERAAAVADSTAARDGRLRVIAQVGRPSTRATVGLARRALSVGADAVAAYVPWFYPLTEEQMRAHFLALLDAADGRPALMYNIPPRTVNDLQPPLAGELARAGLAGMKDSTTDFARHEQYLEAVRGAPFELYVGAEPLILRSFRAGATGTINGLLNCRPELFVALRDAVAAGHDARAESVQDEIAALKEQVKSEQSTVIAVKRRVRERLAEHGIDYPDTPRPPFV